MMISLMRVQVREFGFHFWNISVENIFDHSFGHIVTKLLRLFSYVPEKDVTGPVAYHRGGVDWTLS